MNDVPRFSFRGRVPTATELDDLILVECAVREQAGLDEERRPLPPARAKSEPAGNVRAIAAAEGWAVDPATIDDAVVRLTQAQLLTTDCNPRDPGPAGCHVRLTTAGQARAAARAREFLGKPLAPATQDPAFRDIGQVEVTFLGKRFLIGCVEGEEDKAILRAHQFEVDAGEVLKAVTADFDHPRAMLMAGMLAHERIAELEADRASVPASDRVVGLDHNAPDYLAAASALGHLIEVVRESNSYRDADPDDHAGPFSSAVAG